VKCAMLIVEGEIEQKLGGGYRKPGRGAGEDAEQAPSLALG
jgi:hypothetical protein